MLEYIANTVIKALIVTCIINLTLLIPCCRKKKPVEDLMARPKFTAPATTNRFEQNKKFLVQREKPNVEHTISIKLDNNADEEDLKGPRESMSRDPMTDEPTRGGKTRGKGINDFKEEHDKETRTPPSVDPPGNTNAGGNTTQTTVNKSQKSMKSQKSQKMVKSAKNLNDSSKGKKKRQLRTMSAEQEDATQEFKPSKEEGAPPSIKPSLKSARSGPLNLQRRKSVLKTPRDPKNANNKSKRAFSAVSIKTSTRATGRTAQSPTPLGKQQPQQQQQREERTKEVETTQEHPEDTKDLPPA